MGYQISVDVLAHRANMTTHDAPAPVIVLSEIDGERIGWQRHVHQVRFTGPAWTEYGWGPERSHARGTRAGAQVWVYTEHPVEYLDERHIWQSAP